MTEKYLWAGGAIVAGLVLGYAMSDGSDDSAAMTERMAEMEAALTEAVTNVSGDVAALAEGVAANEAAISALTGTVDGQTAGTAAQLEALGAQAGANVAALGDLQARLGELAGAQDGLGAQLEDGLSGVTADMDGLRGDMMTALKDTLAAAAAAGGAVAAVPVAPVAPVVAEAVPEVAAEPEPELSAEGLVLSVGQTGMAGEARVFLSRLSEAGAHLRVTGLGDVTAGVDGATVDVGDGCTVALAGIAGRKAYLEPACVEVAAVAAKVEAGTDLSLSVGETGLFGDMRIFLSRVDADAAELRVFTLTGMSASGAVSSLQPLELGNGCAVALAGIDGRVAHLSAACGDEAAGLGDVVTTIAVPEAEPAEAQPAEAEPAADPEPKLADLLSSDGVALAVGQTAEIGDARLFVQRLPDKSAQILQIGQGAFTLDMFRSVDLGNGCSVSLLGVQDGAAYIEPVCGE